MTNTLISNKKFSIASLILASALLFSCKKFVEVDTPNNRLLKASVFNNDATAISVVSQTFSFIHSGIGYNTGIGAIPIFTGLSGDEIVYSSLAASPLMESYYKNNLTPQIVGSGNIWTNGYQNLFNINDAIEGISQSTTLTPTIKKQLLGESKFMRAFIYFNLVNVYGELPLVLSTDYEKNSTLEKVSETDVWKTIITDLLDSYNLLNDKFLDGTLLSETSERVRPTKWAAAALLSKAYLYNKDWKLAQETSDEVIKNTTLFRLDSLNEVFLKNSHEAILQFQPTNNNLNTWFGPFFIMPDNVGINISQPYYLSKYLLDSFEKGDKRKTAWIGYSTDPTGITYAYPYKYKQYKYITASDPLTEYYMVLRLSDQILIRAEAKAQQGNLSGALEDLKIIRNRAGLDGISSSDKQEIINAILHERQTELFIEWGDRWFDLKRTNQIDNVMSKVTPQKGGTWSNYKKNYPIDIFEIRSNPNLKQTTGY